MVNNIPQIFIGVDISKDFLDIHLYPLEKAFRIANSKKEINKFLKKLASYNVIRIVCESSGGYESLFLKMCREVQFEVWQVQPRRIRAFIISEGIRAKTDKIDARMIALFASKKTPNYDNKIASESEIYLRSFIKRRESLLANITKEKNQLQQPNEVYCKEYIEKSLAFFQKQLLEIENEIEKLMKDDHNIVQKSKIIESMPGIGKVTALTLVSDLPELGTLTNKQIASLVGVAPIIKQSGKQIGRAQISGGRQHIKKVLYMAGLSASRFNPILKNFYKRLIDSGKKPKVALIAVMRKIITILNVMVKNKTLWDLNITSSAA